MKYIFILKFLSIIIIILNIYGMDSTQSIFSGTVFVESVFRKKYIYKTQTSKNTISNFVILKISFFFTYIHFV